MSRIFSGIADLFTTGTAEIFIPLTGPINSTDTRSVKMSIELIAATTAVTFQGRPGVQFSDDGIVWSAAAGINMTSGATYATVNQWTFGDTFTNIFSGPGGIGVNPALFVRFGVMCSNSSGSSVQSGTARIRVDVAPQRQGTIVSPMTKVFTDSTTHSFYPLTGPIPSEQIAEMRSTLEITQISSDISERPAWQEGSNIRTFATPGWGSPTEFDTAGTATGIYYGTTFASISPTAEYVRFGVVAYAAGSNVNAALVTMRIDWRTY